MAVTSLPPINAHDEGSCTLSWSFGQKEERGFKTVTLAKYAAEDDARRAGDIVEVQMPRFVDDFTIDAKYEPSKPSTVLGC